MKLGKVYPDLCASLFFACSRKFARDQRTQALARHSRAGERVILRHNGERSSRMDEIASSKLAALQAAAHAGTRYGSLWSGSV
jgi:hypothetical protein